MMWILVWINAAVILFLYMWSEYEKKYFLVNTYVVQSEKITDGEHTFVFISDLHNNSFGVNQWELLEAVEKANPDAVLIGGDMIVTNSKSDKVQTEIALHLVKRLAEKYPVYYGFGNHESRMKWKKEQYGNAYEEYCTELLDTGAKLVRGNERYLIGTDISVSGLELGEGCYRRISVDQIAIDDIKRELGEADEKRLQILLAHTPGFFEQYKGWGADLVLSGHYHGGTIRIPFLGGFITPQCKFFDPHCGGQFEEDGHTLIVSRGLGTHSVNIRFNNHAELIVVKLTAVK